jgi:hypothetical protein
MVDLRDQVLITLFSPDLFMVWIFANSLGSIYGPFFNDLAIATPFSGCWILDAGYWILDT